MNTTEAKPSSNTSVRPKRSRAAIRAETIQAKMQSLKELYAVAEAEVAAEKEAAAIKQGLSDFVELIKQKEPSEIEGIISMAIPAGAPIEKVESVQRWTESLKAARRAS